MPCKSLLKSCRSVGRNTYSYRRSQGKLSSFFPSEPSGTCKILFSVLVLVCDKFAVSHRRSKMLSDLAKIVTFVPQTCFCSIYPNFALLVSWPGTEKLLSLPISCNERVTFLDATCENRFLFILIKSHINFLHSWLFLVQRWSARIAPHCHHLGGNCHLSCLPGHLHLHILFFPWPAKWS